MIEAVSSLALVHEPLATYVPLRVKVERPVLWAVGLPGPGEKSAGSLAEYEAGIGWLEQSTTLSLAIGVLSAFLFGLVIRSLARSPAADRVDTVRQLVGETCAVCSRTVVFAKSAHWCSDCGACVHLECLDSHDCELSHAAS